MLGRFLISKTGVNFSKKTSKKIFFLKIVLFQIKVFFQKRIFLSNKAFFQTKNKKTKTFETKFLP